MHSSTGLGPGLEVDHAQGVLELLGVESQVIRFEPKSGWLELIVGKYMQLRFAYCILRRRATDPVAGTVKGESETKM